MDINNKGVMFSILAVFISILLVTVYSSSVETQSVASVAQVNSRAELFDSLFSLVEKNINTVIGSTSYTALKTISDTQAKLYNNLINTSYDLDIQCEFPKVMENRPVRVLLNSQNNFDMVLNITNVRDSATTCNIAQEADIGITYLTATMQKFVAKGVSITDTIGLSINRVSGGPIIRIEVLDACKNVLASYYGDPNSTSNKCMTTNYKLNRPVLFKTGQEYYIYVGVNGSSNSNVALVHLTKDNLIEESNVYFQDVARENLLFYDANSSINKTFTKFMSEYSTFLKTNYDIDSEYSFEEIKLSQEDAWSVTIEGKLKLLLKDSFFSVNQSIPFNKKISILGLPDPYFSKYTSNRPIIKHVAKNETSLNISDVVSMQFNETYIKNGASVKYLDRFSSTRKISTCCGIMTFVTNTTLNSSQPLQINPKYSSVASYFFNRTIFCQGNESEIVSITYPGLPSDFQLDDLTMNKFNITSTIPGITITPWCS